MIEIGNRPEGYFERRFLDRCEEIRFESDAKMLMHDAQLLFNRLWSAGGNGDAAATDYPERAQPAQWTTKRRAAGRAVSRDQGRDCRRTTGRTRRDDVRITIDNRYARWYNGITLGLPV